VCRYCPFPVSPYVQSHFFERILVSYSDTCKCSCLVGLSRFRCVEADIGRHGQPCGDPAARIAGARYPRRVGFGVQLCPLRAKNNCWGLEEPCALNATRNYAIKDPGKADALQHRSVIVELWSANIAPFWRLTPPPYWSEDMYLHCETKAQTPASTTIVSPERKT
jgi:hypothetical protein